MTVFYLITQFLHSFKFFKHAKFTKLYKWRLAVYVIYQREMIRNQCTNRNQSKSVTEVSLKIYYFVTLREEFGTF